MVCFSLSKNLFSHFSIKTYVVGTQKNRLIETVLLGTPKQIFQLMYKKIFTILCSKGHRTFERKKWKNSGHLSVFKVDH